VAAAPTIHCNGINFFLLLAITLEPESI
jgi:hypothetical protein